MKKPYTCGEVLSATIFMEQLRLIPYLFSIWPEHCQGAIHLHQLNASPELGRLRELFWSSTFRVENSCFFLLFRHLQRPRSFHCIVLFLFPCHNERMLLMCFWLFEDIIIIIIIIRRIIRI